MDLIEVGIVFLISVFILSGIMKLIQPKSFRKTLDDLQFPKFISGTLTYLVPLLECAAAVLLIFPETRIVGELLIVALLIGFTFSVWKAARLKSAVACNCFGNLIPETIGLKTFYRIVVLLIIDAAIFIFQEIEYLSGTITDWILAALLSVTVIALYSLLMTMSDYEQVAHKTDYLR